MYAFLLATAALLGAARGLGARTSSSSCRHNRRIMPLTMLKRQELKLWRTQMRMLLDRFNERSGSTNSMYALQLRGSEEAWLI